MAYNQQETFYNPKIPFSGSIKGELQEGKSITVSGRVLPEAKRFCVILQCGSTPDANYALYFNPNYESGSEYTVANTKQDNSWGPEEILKLALFPKGNPFELQILVTSKSYKISVNGIHVMDYMHRIPFNMVDTIVVDGMVEVKTISFQDPMCVPYKTTMYGGMWAGKKIVIQGLVNPQASRFRIDLCHKDGIAFHSNPRFDENTVVCNTKTMNEWGLEERSGEIPFEKGQSFQIIISCTTEQYNVFVNGNLVTTFKHRFTNLWEIDVLEVSGDLRLTDVPSSDSAKSYRMPYKTNINGGLWAGKNISIQGLVNPEPYRFKINLCHKDGIAFHYNPRFDENTVVRNNRTVDEWGLEEHSGEMPFQKEKIFQMIISCDPQQYNVFVNGIQVCTFKHRFTNLWEIDALEVSGDLSLTDVYA
ncbi:galectin-9-like [Hemibagrus wyckioides]|uniref:galectin-9-like n=1 Tax=Hemibagrus wyckioides TaxID=337641 RepID=UPI00266CDB96|nr:galectin-9-like [Hemibagrus wyckioides]